MVVVAQCNKGKRGGKVQCTWCFAKICIAEHFIGKKKPVGPQRYWSYLEIETRDAKE